jgi:hypothetical protein
LAQALRDMSFVLTLADPDVWIQKAPHKNGDEYDEMVLVYVDDLSCVSEYPDNVMKALREFYELKEGSVKEPDIYLVADIEMVQLPDGQS